MVLRALVFVFASWMAYGQPRPIVVQGAMPVESEKLASLLENGVMEKLGAWTFWKGTIDGYPVIVSKTLKGFANTAAATAIAVERYHPAAILNQGTAGGHDSALNVFDIVLGTSAINIGAFKTPVRKAGEGANPLEWRPMDLHLTEGSAGEDPRARLMRPFPADPQLLAIARAAIPAYRKGKVVEGVIASSEIWNSELDLIAHFRKHYKSAAEEMETFAAARVAAAYQIPFLGIRVLSNNITNDGKYDGKTAEACQDFVLEVVRAYIRAQRK